MSYLTDVLPRISQFEGRVPWMYLDSVGKVTVGVGQMLPDSSAAIALPFQIAGRDANPGEIGYEFLRVRTMAANHTPNFYRAANSPTLPDDVIDSLLSKVVASRDADLRTHIPGYDALPDSWKMGLLDMAYNLGTVGLLDKFPHFIRAVESGNGQGAEAQCVRPQLGMARNNWTKGCFTEAA